jgi:putative sigma-54 modulation protein
MNIQIKGTGIELTPAISAYVDKRLDSVEKYFEKGGMPNMFVEIGKASGHHKSGEIFRAEVRIGGAGQDVYAVSNAVDLYAAIDMVKDEIVREITKVKGKRETLMRKGGRMIKDAMRYFTDRS